MCSAWARKRFIETQENHPDRGEKERGFWRGLRLRQEPMILSGKRIHQLHSPASAQAAYRASREPGTSLAAESAIPPNRYETPL